jgi:hypothetical protein
MAACVEPGVTADCLVDSAEFIASRTALFSDWHVLTGFPPSGRSAAGVFAPLASGVVLQGVANEVGQRPTILLGNLLKLIAQWPRHADRESGCVHGRDSA